MPSLAQTSVPVGVLGPRRWCTPRLRPKGSRTEPADDAKQAVLEARPCLHGNVFRTAILTGNLLNRSVNIWVVRGLFLLLMKALRASLKTEETRATSTPPMNPNCTHTDTHKHNTCHERPNQRSSHPHQELSIKCLNVLHWLLLLRQPLSPFWCQQGALLAALSPRTEQHCHEMSASATRTQKGHNCWTSYSNDMQEIFDLKPQHLRLGDGAHSGANMSLQQICFRTVSPCATLPPRAD